MPLPSQDPGAQELCKEPTKRQRSHQSSKDCFQVPGSHRDLPNHSVDLLVGGEGLFSARIHLAKMVITKCRHAILSSDQSVKFRSKKSNFVMRPLEIRAVLGAEGRYSTVCGYWLLRQLPGSLTPYSN
jgi:hypothetical protein